MTYRDQFPDFDPATLPELPPGFEDQSWRNDACPSFHDEAAGVALYVDYANAADREFPESRRFTLHWVTEDGDRLRLLCGEGTPTRSDFEDSDDWARILARYEAARRVAAGFEIVERLRDWLTARQWQECAAGKADPPDFCDDNEATHEAYLAVFGDDGFDLNQPLTASRANASTRVARRIIRTADPVDGASLLDEAAADNPVGLSHTITRDLP